MAAATTAPLPSAPPAPLGPTEVAAEPKPKTPEQKLEAAESKRAEGNEKFRGGDTKAARASYEETLKLLWKEVFADVEDEAVLARVKACRVPAQLNLALCCLRAEPCEAFRALELCEEVLDADPENAKASYRKGKALIELGELPEAEFELARACRLAPSDSAVRQDLEKLRKRMRGDKEEEKKTYEGLFDKAPGFASKDRAPASCSTGSAASSKAAHYEFICEPAKNKYAAVEDPHKQALDLIARGQLEDGVFALEAALQQSSARGEWTSHFEQWLELGRLFMDMNVDLLALRCFNMAAGIGSGGQTQGGLQGLPVRVRRNALLLRAVCLLNEAEGDTLAEVSECLGLWLDVAVGAAGGAQGGVEERIASWRQADPAGAGADAAVAQGLLHLLSGREETLRAFVEALQAAPTDEDTSCFGAAQRRAQRWNMLGAVLANRRRHEHALVAYEQALALQPHYPRAFTNRGIALQALGDARGAAGALVAALEALPDWASLLVWKMLEKAAEDQPSVAEAAGQKSLPRLRELLGAAAASPQAVGKDEGVAEVLSRIELA